MSSYPFRCARQDFRSSRVVTAGFAVMSAVSNLLAIIAALASILTFLIHLGSKWLGGPFSDLSITAFHFFVFGCLAICMFAGASLTLTIVHRVYSEETQEDIQLRERLYQDVMSVTG